LSLLERDPEFRLGANGVEEIMNHKYMKDINWDALKAKQIKPPYNPKVKSQTDVKHIDSKYLDEDVISYTIDDTDIKMNIKYKQFDDFTYVKEETMAKAGRKTFH